MKPVTKTILIVLSVVWTGFMLMLDFRNTAELTAQRNAILSLSEKVKAAESNHVQMVDSIAIWAKNQGTYDGKLIQRIADSNDLFNKKIKTLSEFDNVLIQRLEQISKVQNEVIKALTAPFSTNAVDISR